MMAVMELGNSNSNLGRNASELANYINVQEDEDEELKEHRRGYFSGE